MAEETTTTEQATEAKTEAQQAKYTDSQLNDMLAARQGEQVAKLLKELGAESTGKLKDDMKALKALQDANKTEAEKLAASAKEATDKLTAAETRALNAEIKAELLGAGVPKDKIDRALKLVPGYEGETVEAKVAALVKEFPEFKGAAGQNFGGASKNQGADENATLLAQARAAAGLKPRA